MLLKRNQELHQYKIHSIPKIKLEIKYKFTMAKIGLLGGTFDPIHNGHLIISEFLREGLRLEQIWFIPTKVHPLKENSDISSPDIRLKMLELAVEKNDHFKVKTVELKREGVSYTIDTIDSLQEEYKELSPDYYFFIGMDNVNDLHRWKNPDELLKKCKVIAFGRPGFRPNKEAKKYLSRIQLIHVPLLEISSTFIRDRIKSGLSVRYLVPESVRLYIDEKQIYREH
jgi:nicotinate-nucleotide adenylyltransferase